MARKSIKLSFLRAQATKSIANRRTSRFLRRLILSAVDTAARQHYADQYSMKCLQVSAAVQFLLKTIDIESTLWVGATCFAEVYEQDGIAGWGGFWGIDHHVWLFSCFHELIDLSVSQMHHHPRHLRTDCIPIPAIWWNDPNQWPPVIRYLPDSKVDRVNLGQNQADLNDFLALTHHLFNEALQSKSADEINFGPILYGVDTMNELHQINPWLRRAIAFQDRGVPFPKWVQEREAELIAAGKEGKLAASRLSSQKDLISITLRDR